MGIPFKAILDATGKVLLAARRRSYTAEVARFDHGKQQFLMELVTKARTANVCRVGFRPMPGDIRFEYCESLFRDGLLDRDIMTGHYFIRSGESDHDLQGHRPC
ncbi:MAG TPA: hypothetical protein VNY05_02285 [Candidatus Acidoferrales bacterium]|jgi:hypothetical protein|nr:hypothetical protein [Candidatus Acidoferrales bacterium]